MEQTVFVELRFWLLVLFSLVVPVAIVWTCLTVQAVSRGHLLAVGLGLVAIAGFDIYLLQALQRMSRLTPSLADDAVFDSEITVGLYVLPALLAGVGVNITSHVLIEHLTDARHRLARRLLPGRSAEAPPDSPAARATPPPPPAAARPGPDVALQ
jgi:hypothetical protein